MQPVGEAFQIDRRRLEGPPTWELSLWELGAWRMIIQREFGDRGPFGRRLFRLAGLPTDLCVRSSRPSSHELMSCQTGRRGTGHSGHGQALNRDCADHMALASQGEASHQGSLRAISKPQGAPRKRRESRVIDLERCKIAIKKSAGPSGRNGRSVWIPF